MLKSFLYFIRLIFLQRDLILTMSGREIKTQYVGSVLGFLWTFINPIIMICIFWFVFSVGFKAQPLNHVPFAVWLTAGLAVWYFFSEIVTGSTGLIVHNAMLIKKTLFQSQILPVVRIISCLVTHTVFLLVLLGLLLFQQLPFTLYFMQFFYYLLCTMALSLGISWAVSALHPFFRDMEKIVAVVMQVGFWATPIFWDLQMIPVRFHGLLKLNPMFYLVQGYRESFLYFVPFWRHPQETLYFWVVTLVILVGGALVFKKLKPQFADVL
jgi:lipopolysaccharide transport system permease protein